jgi:hypothetical protein
MDVSIIPALAALTGAAVGGLTSGIAAWMNHRSQVRAEWVLHEKSRRQILYSDFIGNAAKCYIDALQHDEADIPGLVGLYAKLSGMRAVSSKTVIQRAEEVARKILDTYLEPDRVSSNCARWPSMARSICYEASATRVATNLTKCSPCNFNIRSRCYNPSMVVARLQSRSAFSGSRA